jgi:hypothetical protein
VAVGGLFAAAVLLHGVVIWDAPFLQAAAVAVAAGMVAVTIAAWQRGGFRRRAVVELRREPERNLGHVAVTVAGQAAAARIELDGRPAEPGPFEGFSGIRDVTVQLPAGAPAETSVWVHHVTPEGDSTPLPADVEMADGSIRISLRGPA